MNHEEAERKVYLTTRAYLLADGDRDGAVNDLINNGLSNVAAGLFADLIPMAFGWGLLRSMGVKQFPSEISLTETDETVKVSDSHVFTAALGVAMKIFENGYTEIFSKRVVEMLVSQSAEVNALNNALNSEPDLDLSQVSLSSSLLGYSAEEFLANA